MSAFPILVGLAIILAVVAIPIHPSRRRSMGEGPRKITNRKDRDDDD